MTAHLRIRRVAKWTGAGLCLALICLGAVSMRYIIRYTFAGPAEALIRIDHGRIDWALSSIGFGPPGWAIDDARGFIAPEWWMLPGMSLGLVGDGDGVPLWLVICAIGVPTLWFWYRDRRSSPPGHCPKCGYNLKGNVSGRCSECGTFVDRRAGEPAAQSHPLG